ncbi:MAG: hypothetical protein ACYTHK_12465 [Planctomycetota bacterium]|jgi:hypothetical protein
MLPNRFRLWLFDRLSVKTMRYVSAVPRREATGLTKRVYDMIEEDFFINGSLTSRSGVPNLLAAIWTSGRETMLVDDHLDRTTKEAVCAVLSDINDCPYCGDMLVSLVDAGKEHNAASSIFRRGLDGITDPRLREQLEWVDAVGSYGCAEIPPCPFTAEELPEVLGSLMAMADINRFSHVVMDGSPVDLPFGLQRPALRMFGRELKATKVRSAEPGRALDLLPPAELPEDLAWARPNPRIADALARWTAVVERETAGVVSQAVRDCVDENLRDWRNEQMPLSRSWVEAEIAGLEGEDRAIARLALLLAKAPHQVSEDIVAALAEGAETRFVRILAWASFTAARRYAAIVAGLVHSCRKSVKAQRAPNRPRKAGVAGMLAVALALLGCSSGYGPFDVAEKRVVAHVAHSTIGSVTIAWETLRHADWYDVYRNNGLIGGGPAAARAWTDHVALRSDTEYRYVVRAYRWVDGGIFGKELYGESDTLVARTPAIPEREREELADLGYFSSLVIDAAGGFHMLHSVGAPAERTVHYARNLTGTWESTPIHAGHVSDLARGPDGSLHAIFHDAGSLFVARESNGAWTTETVATDSFIVATGYDLAVDPDGTLHAVYLSYGEGLRYITNETGAWVVHEVSDDHWIRSFSVASRGSTHVLYRSEGAVYEWTDASGEWSTTKVFDGALGGVDCAFDPAGTLHAVTGGPTFVEHLVRADGAWSSETIDSIVAAQGDVSLAVDPAGDLHVAYHGNYDEFKYATNAGGTWSSVFVDGDASVGERNTIALDPDGIAHIVYSDKTKDVIRRVRMEMTP